MKLSYKFSNLIGCAYKSGNISFSSDGNSLLAPVGNKLTIFDLKRNKTESLPCECNYNISIVALSPNNCFLILVDETGQALFISLISKKIIHSYNFKESIKFLSFSPNGKKFAVAKGNGIIFFKAPGTSPELNPFIIDKKFNLMHDQTIFIDWTTDSKAICVGSKDMNTYIIGAEKFDNLTIKSLGGLKDIVVGCYFEKNSLNVFSVSELGELILWDCDTNLSDLIATKQQHRDINTPMSEDDSNSESDTKKFKKEKTKQNSEKTIFYTRKNKCNYKSDHEDSSRLIRVTATAFHKNAQILVAGFENGVFYLHQMPEFNLIHSLSIADEPITTLAFDQSGEWLGLGCSVLGQLVVWEWQSETYILKQQGHFSALTCLAYSPDASRMVTGGEDSKVKVWNIMNSYCFVTFTEHSSYITGVAFKQNGQVVVSSSLDGTVRAFDLARYRNFRTFVAPERTSTQFACLALDPSGDIVCAGAQDNFEIYCWSMQTGSLLNILSGHEGPVSSLAFSSVDNILASTSWDHTVRLWSICNAQAAREVIQLTCDGLAVAFRPDGKELAVATLDGTISFWDTKTTTQIASIEGKHDLGYTRKEIDKITAKKASASKAFRTLCYTMDGECLLAGGQSKNICFYSVRDQMLIKRFQLTTNLSLDGTQEFLSRRNMTEWGNMALVEDDDNSTELSLPGVRTGEFSSRTHKPEIRVSCVKFSPTGMSFSATTTEGLLTYSLNDDDIFDPFDLSIDITPLTINLALSEKDFLNALMMAFKLNDQNLIIKAVETISIGTSLSGDEIRYICSNLADIYVDKLISFLSMQLETSVHIEVYARWAAILLQVQTRRMRQRPSMYLSALLRQLHKSIVRIEEIQNLCNENIYTLDYLISCKELKKQTLNNSEIMETDAISNHSLLTSTDSDSD